MVSSKLMKMIETHTAGNPTRHIVSGVPRIIGETMAEKMKYVHDHLDWIRRISMMEPRGHASMSGVIYTAPCDSQADMGVIYFDSCDYMTMCGHSTIAVATVLVETGVVPMREPLTRVKLDTPAGLVSADVHCDSGRVVNVSFRNVPSFLYAAKTVQTKEFGELYVEVSFGGMAYAIISADSVGLKVCPKNLADIIRVSHSVYPDVQAQIGFIHPAKPFIDRIHSMMWYQAPTKPHANSKEVVVVMPAEEGNATAIDRSPCGTGTSARIAAEYAMGRLPLDTPFVQQSIIETEFIGRIKEDVNVAGYKGGIPEITGAAYFTAQIELVIDPNDPIQDGFIVG